MREARGRLKLPINGEEIAVPSASHLKCPKCGEIVLRFREAKRLHEDAIGIYRQKHGLLSADEIRAIRAQFDLKQSDLARLLRLGAAERLLPVMPRRFIAPRGQRWSPPAGGGNGAAAGLFAGCVMSTVFAETTMATARCLARRGHEVVAPAGQGCCGALQLHAGLLHDARQLARANIRAFRAGEIETIVVNAAGCGSTLKGYGHLLAEDAEFAEPARAFATRVRDVSELLAGSPAPPAQRQPVTVTYQEPCHLAHAQRIGQQPRKVLREVPGVELREMRESALCCGSAGIYNLTHHDAASALLSRKLGHARDTGAEVIATANPGCLLQLQAGAEGRGLDLEVRHIVDLLDAAERPCDPPGWGG